MNPRRRRKLRQLRAIRRAVATFCELGWAGRRSGEYAPGSGVHHTRFLRRHPHLRPAYRRAWDPDENERQEALIQRAFAGRRPPWTL